MTSSVRVPEKLVGNLLEGLLCMVLGTPKEGHILLGLNGERRGNSRVV